MVERTNGDVWLGWGVPHVECINDQTMAGGFMKYKGVADILLAAILTLKPSLISGLIVTRTLASWTGLHISSFNQPIACLLAVVDVGHIVAARSSPAARPPIFATNLTLAALGFLACLTPLEWGLGSATLLMISLNHMSFSFALYFLDCGQDRDRDHCPSHKLDGYVKPPKDAMPFSNFARGKVTGILFAEDADEPRLIHLNTLTDYTLAGKTWQTVNMRPYLPDNEKQGRARARLDGPTVPREGGIRVGLTSDVFYRSNFTRDGSKRNRCIERLTKGKMAHPWTGPFIMLRRTLLDTSYDAVMEEDMSMLTTFFTTGQMNNFSEVRS